MPVECEHCQDVHVTKTALYQEEKEDGHVYTDFVIIHLCPACVTEGEKCCALLPRTSNYHMMTVEELQGIMVRAPE